MVQLHFSEETIKSVLKHARDDLGKYSNVLEALYYDLVGDPKVTSLSTIKIHLDKARVFLRWLMQNNAELSKLSMDHLRRYIIHLRLEKKLSPSTLATHIRVLRRLLRLLGYSDLAEKLKYPSEKNKPPQLPSPQLIEKVIGEARDPRYKTILAIIYETGAGSPRCLA